MVGIVDPMRNAAAVCVCVTLATAVTPTTFAHVNNLSPVSY